MSILEWPDVLRSVGINVYERPGWRNNQPLGPLQGLRKIYWHHDGSPTGSSPGAWDWITSAYDLANPSAQMWLSYDAQWRFVGSGVAYHAGVTVDPTDWHTTVGLETDHTNNEEYTALQRDVLHRGFAAICKHEGRNADFITFHKLEARPLGRKVDPYLTMGNSPDDQSTWTAELVEQRSIIQSIINGTPVTPPPSKGWLMALSDQQQQELYDMVADLHYRQLPNLFNGLFRSDIVGENGVVQDNHGIRQEVEYARTHPVYQDGTVGSPPSS